MIKKALIILIIFLVYLKPSYVLSFEMVRTSEVTVQYQGSLKAAALEVADLYLSMKLDLESYFGWPIKPHPLVILYKDNKLFQQVSGNRPIVAFAKPDKNLIVINYSKMIQTPFKLDVTLKHEICHLLLHHNIKREVLPKWLDEGISEWISDGSGEILRDPKLSYLDDALLSGHFISLKDLRNGFPDQEKLFILAYEESKSIVRYIERNYGKKGLLHILDHLKNGYEIKMAVEKSLDISFDELEKNWRDGLRKKSTWITYFALYIYEFIFVLAAILTVAGFIRFLIKKRAYEDDEDDDIM